MLGLGAGFPQQQGRMPLAWLKTQFIVQPAALSLSLSQPSIPLVISSGPKRASALAMRKAQMSVCMSNPANWFGQSANWAGGHFNRFGAQTIAKFRAFISVKGLREIRCKWWNRQRPVLKGRNLRHIAS
jgi:hypothetical protein